MEELRSLEDLLDLQQVDSAIDRLLERRSGLPILAEYKTSHAAAARLDKKISAGEEHRRELALAEDRIEGEMKIDEEKLQREEQRLYAGGLSARDATHLRDEVEMLRKRISTREDEALALLEQQQAAVTELDALRAEAAEVATRVGALEAAISAEWKTIDAEVAKLESRKAEIVPTIDGELLSLYEEIRPSKEGVAAAPLAEGVCGGCHLRLSAAEESQVRKVHPPRCLHCRRILVPR